jgi:hypothetical protein
VKTRTAIALLIGAALATPAEAQTVRAKTFVRERILLGFSRFTDQGEIEGYLSMMDLSGIGSHIDIFLRDAVTKEPIYDCAQDAPGQRDDLPPQDFNIVQVGPFAQQATAAVLPGSPDTDDFIDFMHSFCTGPNPNNLTVSCPYQGLPIGEAPHHVTVRHTGTYRGSSNQLIKFDVSGHKDLDACEVVIDGVAYAADGMLLRLTEKAINPTPETVWDVPDLAAQFR